MGNYIFNIIVLDKPYFTNKAVSLTVTWLQVKFYMNIMVSKITSNSTVQDKKKKENIDSPYY